MRAYKLTFWITSCIAVAMLVLSWFITTRLVSSQSYVWLNVINNISIGLMTGAIVAGCTTFASYAVEKQKLQDNIHDFLRDAYLNVSVLQGLTGLISIVGWDAKSLNNELKFIDDLAKMTQESANALHLKEYSLILPSKLQDLLFSDLSKFKKKIIFNLRTSTQEVVQAGLAYELMLSQRGTGPYYNGGTGEKIFEEQLRIHQDILLSKKSHLHGFEASLAIEADDLLTKFFGEKKVTKKRNVWTEELKREVDSEIIAIVSLKKR